MSYIPSGGCTRWRFEEDRVFAGSLCEGPCLLGCVRFFSFCVSRVCVCAITCCVLRLRLFAGRKCSSCIKIKSEHCFHSEDWAKPSRKCKLCLASSPFRCSICKNDKCKDDFSLNQLNKGGEKKCTQCVLAKVIVDKKNAGQAGGKAGKIKDKIKAGKAGKIEDKKKAGKVGKKIDKKKAGKAGSVDKKREAGGVSGLIRKIKSWKDGLFDNPFGHSEQFIRSLKCRFDVPNAVKRKLPQRSKEEKARRFRIERIETGQRWLYQANKENDIDARRGAGLRYSKKFKRWLSLPIAAAIAASLFIMRLAFCYRAFLVAST